MSERIAKRVAIATPARFRSALRLAASPAWPTELTVLFLWRRGYATSPARPAYWHVVVRSLKDDVTVPFALIVKWYSRRFSSLGALPLAIIIEVTSVCPSAGTLTSGKVSTLMVLNTNEAPVVGLVPTAWIWRWATILTMPVPVSVMLSSSWTVPVVGMSSPVQKLCATKSMKCVRLPH
jgi:hypothetical protein